MNKKPNVYSFNDECYVYLGDYEQFQNNWNELKKHLEEVIEEIENNEYADAYDNCELATTRTIFHIMQELEKKQQ